MQITWVGHACLLIDTGRTRCLTDPWLFDPIFGGCIRHEPPRKHRLEDLIPVDVVCLTHAHFDHFDMETLSRLDKEVLVVVPVCPIRDMKKVLRGLGFRNLIELKAWKSHTIGDLQITAIPSVGVPEEIAYVFSGNGFSVFDAADCVFEPIAARVREEFRPVIGFIPFTGWDYTALLGIEPERVWKPDYDALSRTCTALGLRYVVPAASNIFWYPKGLRWLNQRVCPGDAKEFAESLERVSQGQVTPLLLEPGDGWDSSRERPVPSNKLPRPSEGLVDEGWEEWLQSPRLKSLAAEETEESLKRFLVARRRQLVRSFFSNPKFVLGLLTSRFLLATHDAGRPMIWSVCLADRNPLRRMDDRARAHFGIYLLWEDLSALLLGIADSQDLMDSGRLKLYFLRESKFYPRVGAMEYIFFTRSEPHSRLTVPKESSQNS